MKEEVWNLRIQDAFCLDCDKKMEYYGYENSGNLEGSNVINSETYDSEGYQPHIFLNFNCPQCKKKTSVMTH